MAEEFIVKLWKSPNKDGWSYLERPRSAKCFGTKGLVKVRRSIGGHEFTGSFMGPGDGTHELPVETAFRKAIGEDTGDEVTVRLEERRRRTRHRLGDRRLSGRGDSPEARSFCGARLRRSRAAGARRPRRAGTSGAAPAAPIVQRSNSTRR